jgi:energy-coupling factor transporter transmembrane protein EcfT
MASREPHAASGLRATAVGRDRTSSTRKATIPIVAPNPERSATPTALGAPAPWHALTWFTWAIAASATIQLAPSPVSVALVIGISWLVVCSHGLDGPLARAFPVLVAFAVVFGLLRVALAALTTHGAGGVLFTTPSFTVPEVLGGFTVGGGIEASVVARAAADAFVILGILAVFGAFNAVVSHYELVQSLPRAFHEAGLIVVVSLAFVPSTIAAVHDVAESDRARTGGRLVRRGRLLRRLVPILEGGLERAVVLSESLDSRGFARGGGTARARGAGWCGVAALAALGGTLVALVARERTVAAALGGVGIVGLAAAVALAGRASGRTSYRRRRLAAADWAGMAVTLVAPVALAVLAATGRSALTWVASPLRWPALDLVALLPLVALLAPLVRPAATAAPVPASAPTSAPTPAVVT